MTDVRILIPCRRASTRFPDKALAPILGKPSIRWVVEAAVATGLPVDLCTDWQEISDATDGLKRFVCIERVSNHPPRNGTERCSMALDSFGREEWMGADRYIIVAGDEITVTPEQILRLADAPIPPHYQQQVTTLVTTQGLDDAVTTCWLGDYGFQLEQFAKVPRKGPYVATGLYSYDAAVLRAYKDMPVMGYEQVCDVELSRVLHNGFAVAAHIDNTHSGLGLNTPEDVKLIEECLSKR